MIFNREAEESVLGAALIDPGMRVELEPFLEPDDFYLKKCATVWRAMLSVKALDFVTLMDALDKEREWIEESWVASLLNIVPTSTHAVHFGRIVKRDSLRRQVQEMGHQLTLAAGEMADADELLAFVNAHVLQLGHTEGGPIAISQHCSDTYDEIEEWAQNPIGPDEVRGLDTGFPDINRLTGGYDPGELIVVCCRPSVGKSAFVFETARRVALRGKSVLIFSLEMTARSIMRRWASAMSRVPTEQVKRGQGDLAAYMTALAQLSALSTLWIDDSPGLSPHQIRAHAMRKKAETGVLDLIVVDHGRKMRLKRAGSENTSSLEGRKTALMKDLAKELDCVVMLALQLNRGPEGRADKIPSLGDLRDSGEHEEEADSVLGLYREEYYDSDTDRFNTMDVHALKQREGGRHSVATLYYDPTIQRFDQVIIRKVALNVEAL